MVEQTHTNPRDPHRRAWDTIPWVVAGSASADDAAWLEQHLAQCDACREEQVFQQSLHHAMRQRPLPATDTEAGLQRLMARIDGAGGAADAFAAASATATDPQPAQRRASWLLRGLVAAVVVQAVGLATATFALWERGHDGAAYRTYSTPATSRPASLRLVPAPGMDMGTLRALLAAQGLEIVDAAADGSSLGLVVADGRAETLAQALAALRAHPGVRLAEPTGHAPR